LKEEEKNTVLVDSEDEM